MKKKLMIIISVVCVALFVIGIGAAQDNPNGIPTQITTSDLFTWLMTNPPNLATGAIFLILGFIGALVAIFGLIGSVVPGTNGKATLEIQITRLETEEKRLDQLINDDETNPELLKAVEIAVNNIRDDITQERRKQFNQAACIYLILGAFFAAMLATNMLQAIVIGFGWTAVIGVLGLKNDQEYRKDKKDEAIGILTEKNDQLIQHQGSLAKQIADLSKAVTNHQPEKGSVRTEADIEHNNNLATIVGSLKDEIDLTNVCLTDDNYSNVITLARML
jgi:hypothetical protein